MICIHKQYKILAKAYSANKNRVFLEMIGKFMLYEVGYKWNITKREFEDDYKKAIVLNK